MAEWNITSYAPAGQSAYTETCSMPGQQLYVIIPDENDAAEAKEKIREVYGTDDQSGDSNESSQ